MSDHPALSETMPRGMRRDERSESAELSAAGWRRIPVWAGAVVAAVGLLAFAGWALEANALKSILPAFPTMKANTALCFFFSGLALALHTRRALRFACAGMVFAVAGLTFVQYLAGADFGLDQLLFRDQTDPHTVFPGRMAEATALGFLLSSVSLLMLGAQARAGRRAQQTLAVCAGVIGVVALLGYAYNAQQLYRFAGYSSMALHTAASFVVLTIGLIFARPDGLARVLIAQGSAAALARSMLPAALLLPAVLGWLVWWGLHQGYYGLGMDLALLVLALMLSFAALVLGTARALERSDAKRREADAAKRASEERLSRAQAIAHLGSWELNLVQNRLTWSDEVYRIFGLPPQAFAATYEAFLDRVHPDDRQKVDEAYSGSLRENRDTYEVEHRIIRQDTGETRVVHERCEHFRDTNGNIVRSIGMVHDITARKQAEEKLRESEGRLRLALEAGDFGTWDLNLVTGKAVRSMRHDQIFGYHEPQSEWSLDIALRHILPEDRQKIQEAHTPAPGKDAMYVEARIRRADGSMVWIMSTGRFHYDAQGRPLRVIGVCADITERRRADDAMRASEERFSAIIRTAMDAIIALDQDQRVILFNAAAEHIFRCSAAEAIGKPLDRFIPERYREVHRTHIDNFGKTGVTARSMASPERLLGQRADGELFPFEATISRAHTAGQELYTVILRDISEREKAEQTLRKAEAERVRAEQANAAKANFLANISHELRTPLNAILGFSRLVRNAPDVPAEQIRNLDIINRSGEHLLNLINNVLDMSRIESGHMELKEVGSDLGQMLQEVQSLLQVQAAEKGLVLVAQRAPPLPRQVGVDADKLRQVLINLVANAIKFSTRGSVILRARVSRQEPPQTAWVRFEVEDAGPGISEQDRKRIFSPFVQLGEQPRTDAGTGLGLAISRRYIELMGGQVDVVSKPGKGSVFYFEIPVHLIIQSGRDSGDMQHGHVVALAPGQPTYRLLIAEDQAENRLLLRMMLEPLGFDLREAKDGQEAMALFEQWRPDLIWMDIGMPKTDGLQVTRQIRACAAGASTKVVAVTAHVFEDERRKILAAGCDGFIRKPYRETEIFDALKEHLGVRFLYAEERPSTAAAKGGKVSVAQLAELPPELLETLRDAAVLLDTQRCLDLAAKLERIDAELGANLRRMLDNLQFSELIQTLDNAIAMRPA